MPIQEFHPKRTLDIEARIRHIENALTQTFGRNPKSAAIATNAGAFATGAIGAAGGSGGTTITLLSGDVTGPTNNTLVSQLQGVTLTLTNPLTGQVITFNGTAWVNSSTIQGSLTVTGTLTTAGFATAVTTKTTNYTLLYTDYFVEADATAAPFTLTLPTAVGHSGQQFAVKKVDSTVNAVTVATTGGQSIDGGATAVIRMPQTSLTCESDGANWRII